MTPDQPFAEVRRRAGSTGYFSLDVPEGGNVRVRLTGSREPYGNDDTPDPVYSAVRWMVVRGG